MFKMLTSVSLLTLSAVLVGCGGDFFITDAKKQTEKYYEFVKNRQYDSALTLYTASYLSDFDTAAYVKFLEDNGAPTSTKVINTEGGVTMEPETHYDLKLSYKVKYSSGAVYDETFFFSSVGKFSNKFARVVYEKSSE